jgi:alkanesulfonate monooxygenase SsuD/methylene tetrahydromethanopterin reductase-like flavin-dependent oxidoreductase (luciferase family)
LPLVARYAQEWNATFQTPTSLRGLNAVLDEHLARHNRPPASVRRSMMTGTLFGRDEAEFRRVAAGRDIDQARSRGVLCGTPSEFQDQLSALAEAGLQGIMLQWLDLYDLDRLEALAKSIL